jgi:transglutaminase-like putative cysteine protease
MSEYVDIPVRLGSAGVADKDALLDAEASKWASSRWLQDFTLELVAPAGNDARAAARRICAFVGDRPYRREPGEIFRHPEHVARWGGDCDDLALLCVAMLRSVGLPARFAYAFTPNGSANHVWVQFRAPAASSTWQDFDPVRQSELVWMTGSSAPPNRGSSPLLPFALGIAIGWWLSRRQYPTRAWT